MNIEPANNLEDTRAVVVMLCPIREFEYVGSLAKVKAHARNRLMSHLADKIEEQKLSLFVDRRQNFGKVCIEDNFWLSIWPRIVFCNL